MIIDKIENHFLYFKQPSDFYTAFEHILNTDFLALYPGRYDLTNRIYFSVAEYQTRPEEGARWEAHRKYADIQFVVRGEERVGYAPMPLLKPVSAYEPENDIQWFEGKGLYHSLIPGFFTVFFPSDGHMPCIVPLSGSNLVKKVVFKVML